MQCEYLTSLFYLGCWFPFSNDDLLFSYGSFSFSTGDYLFSYTGFQFSYGDFLISHIDY